MVFSWLIGGLLFMVGAAVGSFLNVLVSRSLEGKNWLTGRSQCDHCDKQLAWYENIPLLSFVLLHGRCAHCQRPIDLSHFLAEILTGSLFLWWYAAIVFIFQLVTNPLAYLQPLFWLVVGLLAVVIFISDWRYQLIPRWTIVALTALSLAYRLLLVSVGAMQSADFWQGLLATLLLVGFFFGLWKLTKERGFGDGDVQLAVPLGLLLGTWQRITVAVMLAFFLGAAVGLVLILFKRKKFGQTIAFGPFLLLGALLSLVWGYEIWDWYVRILSGTAL